MVKRNVLEISGRRKLILLMLRLIGPPDQKVRYLDVGLGMGVDQCNQNLQSWIMDTDYTVACEFPLVRYFWCYVPNCRVV